MANKFVSPKGRMTIRKSGSTFAATDPMKPSAARENRRVRLWDMDPAPGSMIAKLEQNAYLASLAAIDAVEEYKATTAKSGKFTEQGLADATRNFVLNSSIQVFARARNTIRAAKAEAKDRREKLTLRPLDRTDVVGEMQRQEIRNRLAAMSAPERDSFMTANIDKLGPTTAAAILSAEDWLSGVPASYRDLLKDRALQSQHGAAVAELQELERAIEYSEGAVEVGRDEARLEAGIPDPAEFDRLAAPIEMKVGAPWLRLRKNGDAEEVRVFDLEKRIERLASPEEKERGVFYESYEAYRKDNPEITQAA
jgi:hypothetical protein